MVYAIDLRNNFQPAKITNVGVLLNTVLPLLILFAAFIFLFMGFYGGFIWITSGGEKENLAKAQKIFTNAIIGLFITVFGFAFVKLIGYMLNINILP